MGFSTLTAGYTHLYALPRTAFCTLTFLRVHTRRRFLKSIRIRVHTPRVCGRVLSQSYALRGLFICTLSYTQTNPGGPFA